MSQTETLMVLVLGFVLALICVLFFGRQIWNIGQRLARRRAEKAKPALIRDLEADRDQLRASHAMMTQRLTSGLADAKAKVITQQAEVSRHRNRLLDKTATINTQIENIAQLDETVQQLTRQSNAQGVELDARAELIAEMKRDAEAREDDIQMLRTELQKTASLLDESKEQLQRLETERADAVERQIRERETFSRVMAERDAERVAERKVEEGNRIAELHEKTIPYRTPLAVPQGDVVVVKPAGSTQPQLQMQRNMQDDGLSLPPVPQRPTRPSDLANLMQNARRTMMERQAEQRGPDPESKRSRAIANVMSLAQKIRSEREE